MHDAWLDRWLPLIAERAAGSPVLELGCGPGEDTATLLAANIDVIAKEIGLDMAKFTADIDNQKHKAEIAAMTNEFVKHGATGTPATFINGRFLNGAQPLDAFKKIIDEELGKSTVAGGTK